MILNFLTLVNEYSANHQPCHCSLQSQAGIISPISHLKSRVFSVSDIAIKVLQVNSQLHVIRCRQTVKIGVSKPELAVQISKSIFVQLLTKIEINRAVQTSLKNGPTSTVRSHVAQHLHRFATIWFDCVHSTGCDAIATKL